MTVPQTAARWWGETATKVAVAVVTAGGIGLGGWMFTMYTQLLTLNVKLDTINKTMADNKGLGLDAQQLARENSRRIDRIENTRFTSSDAEKALLPVLYRLDLIESRRTR